MPGGPLGFMRLIRVGILHIVLENHLKYFKISRYIILYIGLYKAKISKFTIYTESYFFNNKISVTNDKELGFV